MAHFLAGHFCSSSKCWWWLWFHDVDDITGIIIMIITAIIIIIIFISVFEFISACWLSRHIAIQVIAINIYQFEKQIKWIPMTLPALSVRHSSQWCWNRKWSIELLQMRMFFFSRFVSSHFIYTLFFLFLFFFFVLFVLVSSVFLHFITESLFWLRWRWRLWWFGRRGWRRRRKFGWRRLCFGFLSGFQCILFIFSHFDVPTIPCNKQITKTKHINIVNETNYITNKNTTFTTTRKIEHVLNIT